MSLPRLPRGLAVGLAALTLGLILVSPTPGADRRPFVKPGTPRRSERVRTFDVEHIRAELTIDPSAATLKGTVTHTLKPLHPKLSVVTLDCGPKLKVGRVSLVGGPELTFQHEGEKLAITLDRPYSPDESLSLAVEYSGAPERGMNFIPADPTRPEIRPTVWTQGEAEETHDWLPCYDAPNDRATSEMIVTVPKAWTVVSNGRLVEDPDPGGNPDVSLVDRRAAFELFDLDRRGRVRPLRRHLENLAGGLLRPLVGG